MRSLEVHDKNSYLSCKQIQGFMKYLLLQYTEKGKQVFKALLSFAFLKGNMSNRDERVSIPPSLLLIDMPLVPKDARLSKGKKGTVSSARAG